MFSHSFLKRFKLNYFCQLKLHFKSASFQHNNGSSDSNKPIFSSIDCNPLMTPFASVFQRMLWLVLVSFLSDYKTLPAFHPSEHTQVNEDEKKSSSDIEFMSWVCASDCVYSNAEKAYTWFPVEDLVLSMSVCNVSLCVYCTWFCPCFTFLFTCPRVCTARDFAPAIRPCCLSLCVYCTWFCPCYTFLLPVHVCVPHEILLLTRIALTCPCNTSPRFSLSPRNPYDITYRFFGPF